MRVLIVAADLSPTTLFDLVVAQEVSRVLDLRASHRHAVPRLLERIYQHPPKALAAVVFRRVVSSEAQGLADRTLLVLIDGEGVDAVRRRVLALRSDAHIEVRSV
jgi:hypothetical protein